MIIIKVCLDKDIDKEETFSNLLNKIKDSTKVLYSYSDTHFFKNIYIVCNSEDEIDMVEMLENYGSVINVKNIEILKG